MSTIMEKPKKIDVADLISLSHEVKADDTLREFHQFLRFQFIQGVPLRMQLLFDRRHKAKKGLSKPVGYFRMSQVSQLLRLGNNAYACAVVLAFHGQGAKEPTVEEIEKSIESLWPIIKGDLHVTAKVTLDEIQLHKRAQQRSRPSEGQ